VGAAVLQDRRAQGRPQGLGRGQDPLHVHVEPAVHGLLDEVAAHDDQQQRRRDRHQQEDQDQTHPETGPEDAPPPLHEDADEVAAQDEHEHEQQAEVEDRQPVQEDRGQEVGGEVPALAEERLERHEREEGAGRDGQDQAGVVAERGSMGHIGLGGPLL